MRWVVLLLLVGCNEVWELDGTKLAESPRDSDNDGILDAVDNCVAIQNANQEDRDGDGRGDVCDNCEFMRNGSQSDVDGDSIGDSCDPHPEDGADCLVLVDTFGDPNAFMQHWSVLAETGDTPEVTPSAGSVRLVPHTPRRIGIVAKDANGAVLGGVFEGLLRGHVTLSNGGSVGLVSNASRIGTGYSCSIRGSISTYAIPMIASANGVSAPSQYSGSMSSEAVGDTYVLRLNKATPKTQPYPDQCRADYGVAVGERTVAPMQMPVGGGAGVIADRDVTDIEAIALYQYGLATCPTPIRR